MTKREMMVKAHMMAKKMIGNYAARLALALQELWATVKKGMKTMKKEISVNELASLLRKGTLICLNHFEVVDTLLRQCKKGEKLFSKDGELDSSYVKYGGIEFYVADFADNYNHHCTTGFSLRKFYIEE